MDLFYKPAPCCIYCRSDGMGAALTAEHIVPLALGGKHILPNASCSKCQEETSRIELVARTMFGDFRNRAGIQTRHKKRRKSELPVIIDSGMPDERVIEIPVEDHPGHLILPAFPPPSLFLGKTGVPLENCSFGMWNQSSGSIPTAMKEWFESGGPKSYAFELFIDVIAFSRVLAKIAHAAAVAEFGIDGFEHFLQDTILGRHEHPTDYVGCPEHPWLFATGDAGDYAINFEVSEDIMGMEEVPILFAQIQIFMKWDTPAYFVIIGRANSATANRVRLFPGYSLAKPRT